MNYEVKEQLYEGKAKQVFATNDPEIVMVHYKDDATAGDGEKKGTIRDKGIVNNKLSNALMQKLEKEGIPTHYVEELNDRDTLVKKVQIVPLEVIIRNVAAGHFSLRMGVPEGKVFKTPILEYSYKNDDLHDPSAVTELDNMLNEINTDVQPGTAGSSLKTVKVAANLLDWGTETSLSQEEIKSETVRWLSDKGNDEQAEFSQKIADVYDAYQELLGENAEELLSSAGYTGKGYPWGSSKVEEIGRAHV